MNAGILAMILVVVGGFIYKLTDFERAIVERDFKWNIPTEWWALVAYGQAVVLALLACRSHSLAEFVGLGSGGLSCPDALLAGLGFGTVATFVQKLLSKAESAAPKGLTPR